MEYYSSIKKNNIMALAATWMDLEIVIQSEVSQKEKNKCMDSKGLLSEGAQKIHV